MNNYINGNIRRIVPPVTLNLIIINTIVWLAQLVLPKYGFDLTDMLGLHFFISNAFNPLQIFSYMFLHSTDGIGHLFFNMFALWMFGSVIERFWGAKRYILFYITCGISAALVQELVWYISMPGDIINGVVEYVNTGYEVISRNDFLSSQTTIGASGAVFGLLLAFGMLFPNSKIYIYFFIPMKAKYFVILYGLAELLFGISGTMGSVAHFAHLGGMLGGIILIMLWRKKGYIDGPYN